MLAETLHPQRNRNCARRGKASDPDDGVVPYVEEGESKL